MIIVATLMVRDEVDVVAAMLEHTLAQGVDLVIVTDNASEDGTLEVLEDYASAGAVELHHDARHRKQQGEVVTRMARRARTRHAADWVLNLDADEFCVPVDKDLTLRQAFERIPLSLNAFGAPVSNLVGSASAPGPWADRLVHRDRRTPAELAAVGLHAHPTPNAVHRGESDVTVAQGNHFVSLRSNGQPDDAVALEVLHAPWRSWAQLERKVVQAGRGYAASPLLRPSPRHHGMADYRRHTAERLRHAYALRLPEQSLLDAGVGFEHDPWLRDHLHGLLSGGGALRPERLAAVLAPEPAELDAEEHAALATLGRQFAQVELDAIEAEERAKEALLLAQQMTRERDAARQRLVVAQARQRELRTTAPTPLRQDVRRVGGRVVRAVRGRVVRLKKRVSG